MSILKATFGGVVVLAATGIDDCIRSGAIQIEPCDQPLGR
jgi:hypothetical protein